MINSNFLIFRLKIDFPIQDISQREKSQPALTYGKIEYL